MRCSIGPERCLEKKRLVEYSAARHVFSNTVKLPGTPVKAIGTVLRWKQWQDTVGKLAGMVRIQ
jgi:hypothetical protein